MANFVVSGVSVLLKPSLDGFHRAIKKELNSAGMAATGRDISDDLLNPIKKNLPKAIPKDALAKQARDLGDSVGQSIGRGIQGASSFVTTNLTRVVKGAALAAGAAVVGIMGYSLKKGWDRLVAIDDAQAKLKGLGHDAGTVQEVMDNALKAVKGTAFGLGDASSVAATLVAAGIKPGKDLEKTLSLVGDSASIAGMDLESMGLIWSSVMSRGKLQGDDAMQLMSAGIPIYQMVADNLGITTAEAQKMGEQGKISSQMFQEAMDSGVGGAAQEAGKTVSGSIKNMGAAFGRFGAQLLEGIFPYIAPALGAITAKVDELAEHITPLAAAFSEKLVAGIKEFVEGFKSSESGLEGWAAKGQKVREILEAIGSAASWLWDHGLKQLVGFIGDNLVPVLATVIGAGTAVGLLFSNGPLAKGIIKFGGLLTSSAGKGGIAGFFKHFFKGIIDGLGKVAPLFQKFIKYLPTIGKWLSKLKIFLNPVVAIISLIAIGIGLFLTKTEQGKQITGEVVDFIKRAWSGFMGVVGVVADKIGQFFSLFREYAGKFRDWFVADMLPKLKKAWGTIADAILGFWNNGIKPAFSLIGGSFKNIGKMIKDFVGKYLPELGGSGSSMSDMFASAFEKVKTVVSVVVDFIVKYVAPVFVKVFEYMSVAVKIAATVIGKYLELVVAFVLKVLLPAIIWVFQTILIPLFKVIVEVVKVAITVVIAIIQGLVWFWKNVLAPAAQWLWKKVIVPVFEGIKKAVQVAIAVVTAVIDGLVWFWNNVLQPAAMFIWNVMKVVWEGIKIAIAIVVTAITITMMALIAVWQNVLAPVLSWLYEKVFKPVWAAIQIAIEAVVNWFKNVAYPLFQYVIALIHLKFKIFQANLAKIWAYIQHYVIQPVIAWLQDTALPWISKIITWIKDKFEYFKTKLGQIWAFVRDGIIAPVIAWFRDKAWPLISRIIGKVKDAFVGMKNKLKDVWHFVRWDIIQPVLDWLDDKVISRVESFATAVKDAFSGLRDNIGTIWDKIKGKVLEPIKWVVDHVINKGIIAVYNSVARVFGAKPMNDIDTSEWTTDGFATGGYTGAGSKYQPAGVVHADEYVIRKESQNSLRRAAPGFLDSLNKYGAKALGLGGYAVGGLVKLGPAFRGSAPRGEGFGARGGRHKGIDFPMASGTPLIATENGVASRTHNAAAGNKLVIAHGGGLETTYHHLSGYAVNSGQRVTKGQVVAYVGSTGRSTGPHLHLGVKRNGTYVNPSSYLREGGAAGTGGGGTGSAGLRNPFIGLYSKMAKMTNAALEDTQWRQMLKQWYKRMIEDGKSWYDEKAIAFGDTGGGFGRSGNWTDVASTALQATGQMSPGNLAALLARMKVESSGNPRAINNWDSNAAIGQNSRGLMQVIPSTFAAFRDKSLSNDIYDPLANIVASIRYTLARYGSLQRGWAGRKGYADGGLVEPYLHDNGGALEPGLSFISNKTRKPEAILTDKQWSTAYEAMSRQADSRTTTINQYIRDTDATANRIADEVSWGLRRAEIRGRF